jgi:hypothetical protein
LLIIAGPKTCHRFARRAENCTPSPPERSPLVRHP